MNSGGQTLFLQLKSSVGELKVRPGDGKLGLPAILAVPR